MMIHGTVVRGKGDGRTIGYPTANLEYRSAVALDAGVWLCRILIDFELRPGLAVVGMWLLADGRPSVEAHILDFDGDLYGKLLFVSLVKKIRGLENFADRTSLVAQIERDVTEARKYFG